eukprot:scaffold23944_cov62-Isochrysis_galbana.AAC.2
MHIAPRPSLQEKEGGGGGSSPPLPALQPRWGCPSPARSIFGKGLTSPSCSEVGLALSIFGMCSPPCPVPRWAWRGRAAHRWATCPSRCTPSPRRACWRPRPRRPRWTRRCPACRWRREWREP